MHKNVLLLCETVMLIFALVMSYLWGWTLGGGYNDDVSPTLMVTVLATPWIVLSCCHPSDPEMFNDSPVFQWLYNNLNLNKGK